MVNLIKLDYFLNTLALVMWHHRDMRQIMQKALFHAHIDSFLVISVFYDHHYSSSNRDAITCMILGVQKQTCETPSFTIKQTNKIVKLKCFMMIIILLQIVMQSRDTGCPKANWWNNRFSNKKKGPSKWGLDWIAVSGTPSLVKVYKKKHWLLAGKNNLFIRNKSKKGIQSKTAISSIKSLDKSKKYVLKRNMNQNDVN